MSVAHPRTPLETVIDALAARGKRPRGNDHGWTALCPAHDDSTPSLSIGVGAGDRVLMYCHAGCDTNNILAALDLTTTDLFDGPRTNGNSDITATYDYVDEQGTLLFQVVRKPGKQFRQRRPDGNGGWLWKLGDTRRVLYRLPAVLAAVQAHQTVYVVEGEKDADRLTTEGVCATCNPHGAGKWRPSYNATLEGADVVIIADRDEPGRDHVRDIAQQLTGIAATIRTLEPIIGKDISDHLAGAQTLDDLVELDSGEPDSPFLNWHELFTEEGSDDEWLYEDVFALGRGHAVYAMHKQGKSLFLLYCAAHLATTRTDIDVVYVDYEMTRSDIRERLEDMGYGTDSDLTRLHYALLPSIPPLDTAEGMAALLDLVERVQRPNCHLFVVIDTTARAAQGEENSADTYRDFYRWTGSALKRRGITWVRLDHAGKDPTKGQRGSSSKGDDVDVVWRLQQADNGIVLHRDAARMSWVNEKVTFTIRTDPLRYERADFLWPAGTTGLAATLDRLDVPLGASKRQARQMLTEADEKAGSELLLKALRWRREQVEKWSTPDLDHPTDHHLDHQLDQPSNNPVTRVDHPLDHPGPPAAVVDQVSVPIGTDQVDWAIRYCSCGQIATDISGLCPGCIANPGTLPPIDPNDRF